MSVGTLRPLANDAALAELWRAERAVVFKFSPACRSSHRARRELDAFVADAPDIPTYIVDVLAQRDVSAAIAARTGVRHASPQVIVLEAGNVRWSDSRHGITAEALRGAVRAT